MSKDEVKAKFPSIFGKPHNYLAISGGGANGAFGAGVLCGWTETGNRPEFAIVTGISTGALIAPLAFLGPEYDAQVKEIFTTYSTKDLIKKRFILFALFSDALTSTEPLKKLIKKYGTQEVLDKIAVEHNKGRRLFIGTTNLDTGRPMIWNIGIIANSGNPKALEIFQKILLASASIPGAFPPVIFNVEANGQIYDEIHVDGGAASQVFLYPTWVDWTKVLEKLETKTKPMVYVIRNSKLEPDWQAVQPKLLPITGRSINSLIRNQGFGDLYRIYLLTMRDGLEFNLAYIPDDFDFKAKEEFDPVYMKALFDRGYEMAKSGYPWKKAPPDFEVSEGVKK